MTNEHEQALATADPEIYALIEKETVRLHERLQLIASENTASRAILETQGSVLTNKYAEGYPFKRYYDGCEYVDEVEQLAIERGKKLFKCDHINVQPHSGSQANMGAFFALLTYSDRVMGLSLSSGGHLTHGAHVNFTGKMYEIVTYDVNEDSLTLDYDEIRTKAKKEHPRLIIAGGSAYPRIIDFKAFREIADEVGAYLLVDMAHFGGLVAAGIHPSPMPYADIITGTTHKTLRGPRGGYIIATKEDIAKKIDKSIFPGIQGGPLMHVIAAKAVCFKEALSPSYKTYQEQVVKNASVMADELIERGYVITSGGTDTHLMLVDTKKSKGLTGATCATALDKAYITTNKNGIPFDTESPRVTSGIRLGAPSITTRGMKEDEVKEVVSLVDKVLSDPENESTLAEVRENVKALCERFPVYDYLRNR